ncbi:mannan endo-1,6-alpha-mannosidase DCW1-like protein [Coniochaeta sp. 2T2.1]|nr:mannan endo-1,6-alpha-mannosidase DCW1-like protein [Coniochaeta sp. 2T2.1]
MKSSAVSALFWGSALATINVDLNNTTSVKEAAKAVATNLLTYYRGNEPGEIPGILPGPPTDRGNKGDYFWWEGALLWNTLIDYWRATGDASYNDLVTEGILWQAGSFNNFMSPNITTELANDDQSAWAMAAMAAAEVNFTNPSTNEGAQWLALARTVFEFQTQRWELEADGEDTCGGGLRWQVTPFNHGYEYKNSASAGGLFNLAARLARLTGNETYADWAERTYGWMESVGFLSPEGSIYDGAYVETNCTDINGMQTSHNVGVFVQGAAHMYNATNGGETWRNRLTALADASSVFTRDNCTPVEIACEERGNCNTQMLVFKSIFLRGLAAAAEYAPFTNERLSCVFEASARAVASKCSDAGEDKGAECGFIWTGEGDDGSRGAREQMNALVALSVQHQIQAGGPAGTGSGPAAGGNSTGGAGGGSPTEDGPAASGTGIVDGSGAGVLRHAGSATAPVIAVKQMCVDKAAARGA